MSFFERLKTEASAEWRAYTEHPFTNGLADGSLAEAAFRHYLVQDYLFLIEFARAYALSVYTSPKLADMREAAAGLSAILDIEMNLHVKICAGWCRRAPIDACVGIDEGQILALLRREAASRFAMHIHSSHVNSLHRETRSSCSVITSGRSKPTGAPSRATLRTSSPPAAARS